MIRLFRRRPEDDAALSLYRSLVEKAREAAFYAELGVPDTVDGRFDMIVIHAMLVLRRLRNGGARADAVGQALFDLMFKDMDQSLRELGVGDMSIGKHIKRMAKAFYGRANMQGTGLEAALASGETRALESALLDTVFRRTEPAPEALHAIAGYIQRTDRHVQAQALDTIVAGTVDFAVAVQEREAAHAASVRA